MCTTPPATTFGASKKLITQCVVLRRCDIQRIPVIKWVIILGFHKAHQRGGILYGCDKKGVMSVVAKEFGCHTPSRRHICGLPQKTHDRALSTVVGSSSSRRRRRVLPTAMGHAFARPLRLLHLHVSGLRMILYVRTPVDKYCQRYCVLSHVSAHITVSPKWHVVGVRDHEAWHRMGCGIQRLG